MDIVTRIAPSPTGEMHIGTVRAALFNYLFTKKVGGTFFVRIEDTDKERNKSEWIDAIWKDFDWCNLVPDEKYIQSEHIEEHKKLLQNLVECGKAYISKEEAKDGSGKEVEVVRLKNPGKEITFTDLVRGDVTFDTTELGDFVIARSIDDPLYHFAVVADDHAAGVTHVIRGEEHISNTPRQILIQEALGFQRPYYAHVPLILAPDKSKLSKRKHSVSLNKYREQGFLPEAILNYLVLLGWNPGTEEELFTLEELIVRFSLDQVQKHGAVYDETKLRWFNKEHLLKLSHDDFKAGVKKFMSTELSKTLEASDRLEKLLPELRERIEVFGDIIEMETNGEFTYFIEAPSYKTESLLWKKDPNPEHAKKHLTEVLTLLEPLEAEKWVSESVKKALWGYAEEAGKGDVLWPLRYALSGKDKSPDPFTLAAILGKDESLARIQTAIERLS